MSGARADAKREATAPVLFVEHPRAEVLDVAAFPMQPMLRPPASLADGSPTRPFPTLAEALRSAPSGAILRVGEGIWPERIAFVRAASLVGRGAGRTRIVPPPGNGPAVSVHRIDGVQLRGLSVEGAPIGVELSEGTGHRIDNVELRDCAEIGLRGRDASVVVSGTSIADIGEGSSGAGVELERGSIEARKVSLLRAGRRGFLLHTARGLLVDVEVRESGLSAVQATDGADVRVVAGVFDRHAGSALYAGGARLSVEGAQVRNDDFAVTGNRGAEVAVLGGELTDYRVAGVAFLNSSGSVQKALVARGGSDAAISIFRSGKRSPVLLVENRIEAPGAMAVHVTDSSVTARGNSISGAWLDAERDMGDAFYALDSELVLEGNVLRGNAGSGLTALRSQVRLSDNSFIGNGRAGMLLLHESRATVSRNLFARNAQSGVEVGEHAFAALFQNRFGGNQRFDIDQGCGRGVSGTARIGSGNTFETPMRTRVCPRSP